MTIQHSYLTIGKLSELSGIHVKALRYYEKIGILNPNFVNPDNGYRYYSYTMIPYVKLIKICADYGVPLKHFTRYMLDATHIDMVSLTRDAHRQIEEAEQALQQAKQHLKHYQRQMELAIQVDHFHQHHVEMEEELYALFPFEGNLLSPAYYEQTRRLIEQLSECDYHYDFRVGCYYLFEQGVCQQFMALKIQDGVKEETPFRTLCLKDRHTHIEHTDIQNLDDKMSQLHSEGRCEILVLETVENPYNLADPHLEIRYFL